MLIKFDERCRTHSVQDCLELYTDIHHSKIIYGPNGESKLYGHGFGSWPDIYIEGNTFYWSFETQSGGEDWGFLGHVEGEVYGLGNTDNICIDILEAGGIESLIGMMFIFYYFLIYIYSFLILFLFLFLY